MTKRARPRVVVVGAGFGGLSIAIELIRSGAGEVTVLEQAGELGGVWRENTYPGAGCDVPSPLYSFSFAPNREWPRRYSEGPDIKAYMHRVAERYGVPRHVRYGVRVTAAEHVDGVWRIHTAAGETYEAEVFVPAVGQLNRPVWPAIPGMDAFAGAAFHSARWDHSVSLRGKRVAVIGTGASAIQFVPRVRQEAAEVTVFQRSAPYILPKFDRRYGRAHHRLFRAVPVLQLFSRLLLWLVGETAALGLTGNRAVSKVIELVTRAHLRRQVPAGGLRAKLTPQHAVGCKRVLFSSDYYPAMCAPNLRLVTEPIAELSATGVRTATGTYPADVVIYGTGFAATEFLAPMTVTGEAGASLTEAWADGARAYLGMTVPEFPNMFLMYGPNTNLGANSIIYMLERQARYIGAAVRRIAERPGLRMDVRPDVAQRFDDEVQGRLRGTVWTLCRSWYRAANGRVSTNWPGLVSEYHRRTRTLRTADYRSRYAPGSTGDGSPDDGSAGGASEPAATSSTR